MEVSLALVYKEMDTLRLIVRSITSRTANLKALLSGGEINRMNSLIQFTVVSAVVVLFSTHYALSCSKIPYNVTVKEPDCETTKVQVWACMGVCHSAAIPVAKSPYYKDDLHCCIASKFNTTTVMLFCHGQVWKAKKIPVIEECSCQTCSANAHK